MRDYLSKLAFLTFLLLPGLARSSMVEVAFSGDITSSLVTETVLGDVNGPYVAAGFAGETSFHGVLRYDDQAPLYQTSATLGNIYLDAVAIELTIGNEYTVSSAGTIFVRNNYADAFDLWTLTFQDFPVGFINPAAEMLYQNNFLRLEFYADSKTVFDAAEQLPAAAAIDQFNRMYLRELSIRSEADSVFVSCPGCVEGVTEVFPLQEIRVQGNVTSAIATVPLPPSLLLFGSGLCLLLVRARSRPAASGAIRARVHHTLSANARSGFFGLPAAGACRTGTGAVAGRKGC